MAFTRHGHHIIGSIKSGERPKVVKRCGGPRMCDLCREDKNKFWEKYNEPLSRESKLEFEIQGRKKAKGIVESFISDGLTSDSKSVDVEAEVLKFLRVGDNWKAILMANNDDSILYDVIYLNEMKVAEVRIFTPTDRIVVRDGG